MRLFALSTFLAIIHRINADPSSGSALYPSGLLPLINRANALLSSGQFHDAAKIYSEAIEQAPTDYLLYYKRATAYFSISRHPNALDDFEKVLSLTGNTFDNALLMKAKIHAKDGQWSEARDALKRYTSKVKGDQTASELLYAVSEGEITSKKVEKAMNAQLWTACTEAASQALKTASHSVEIRQQRAECALAAGDIESTVGDLTRLIHLSQPSTSLFMRIFRLSYFLLPSSPSSPSTSPALTTLKQCLHRDPDSKPCLAAHRLVKSLDKLFVKLERANEAEDWRGVVTLLMGKDKSNLLGDGLLQQYEEAMDSNTSPIHLSPQTPYTRPRSIPLPLASKYSPRRQEIMRSLCRAYMHLDQARTGEKWCDILLGMEGSHDDVDGLVGKGEAALKREDWEEAVRLMGNAFEASGKSSRDIHQRLQKAQRLLKQSKQKDYYKVLDVARDADARTIKKAYRNAAKKAHPDKGGSEAKMAAVNEAYEVLSNPELRQRFDVGDDPNDPMSQQGGHPFTGGFGPSHPFAQFFQQSGGGGFPGGNGGFKFHFNG